MANVDHNNIAASMANALAGSATKLVICQHNPLSSGFHATVNWKHRVVPWFYGALSSYIDHAVAVSDGISTELIHQAGLPAAKVSTIFNAVIGEDFAARADEPVQHPWLVNKDRPVFVTAGRLVGMKDQRTMLRAFAIHLQTHKARLMILGTGPMLDDLRALTASLGIAEHVEFAGFVPNPLPYMRAADAFVLSSRSEGFGNVLVVAMGCGTPIISTDCPYGPGDILARAIRHSGAAAGSGGTGPGVQPDHRRGRSVAGGNPAGTRRSLQLQGLRRCLSGLVPEFGIAVSQPQRRRPAWRAICATSQTQAICGSRIISGKGGL
jgi:glycosyltransferase involved in cell wall biosynthesis